MDRDTSESSCDRTGDGDLCLERFPEPDSSTRVVPTSTVGLKSETLLKNLVLFRNQVIPSLKFITFRHPLGYPLRDTRPLEDFHS